MIETEITLKMTKGDYELLVFALGIACGYAIREKEQKLSAAIHELYFVISEAAEPKPDTK